MKKRVIIAATIIICSVLSGLFSYNTYLYVRAELARRAAWRSLDEAVARKCEEFRGEVCVVIKDMDRGWEIAFNKDLLLPSASLLKVPVMASFFYAERKGEIVLKRQLTLEDKDKVGGSGKLQYRPSGTKIAIADLIEMMITISDNTATNMLIELLGFAYLEERFNDFGLKNTNLARLMMDMKSRDKGIENYTTARDVALIFDKIYSGELITRQISMRCLEILKRQKSRNRIPQRLPKGTVVAHKTGLENGICHDAGIAFTDNGDFLICVLVKHNNKTSHTAKRVIAQIAFLAYNYYQGDYFKKGLFYGKQ